jgi:hypothetical protein
VTDSPSRSFVGRFIAAFLFIFGFLPIVNWIPGGREAPWYAAVAGGWLSGTAIVVGVGLVAAILGRRWSPTAAWYQQLSAAAMQRPGVAGACLAAASLLLYGAIAWFVFDGTPLHLDEIAQVIQARIFAAGRLYLDAPAYPEFQGALHVLDMDGKWYAQFPPGGPLLLVPGVWAGATWLVGPALGAASVALYWGIVRRTGIGAGVSLGSAVLFAVTPFMAFMSASHMNHVGMLFLALLAWWGAVRHAAAPTLLTALATGAAVGAGATVRPVDALAVATPIGLWMAWRLLRRTERWPHALAMLSGVAIPLAGLLWYNARTTGDPLLFAYEHLWGSEHGLGFHASPWGAPHTPAAGLELVSLYFLRLQTYLFETPTPSLIFVAIGAWFAWSGRLVERWWLFTGALLCALYGLYWHDGFYLGPRFVFLLVPGFAYLAAQAPSAVASRWPRAQGFVVGASLAAVALSFLSAAGDRGRQYSAGLQQLRWPVAEIAERSGVRDAVVLVRETWGSQLVARLWSVGVSRSQTEWIYRRVDACVLDAGLRAIELSGDKTDAFARLRPLASDSSRLVPSPWSPDQTEKALPGLPYTLDCQRRIAEDRAGTFIYTGLLARDWGSNIYLKDLHGLNARHELIKSARPWYLLRSISADPGAPPVFVPISRDSALADWADEEAGTR